MSAVERMLTCKVVSPAIETTPKLRNCAVDRPPTARDAIAPTWASVNASSCEVLRLTSCEEVNPARSATSSATISAVENV